MQTKYIISSYHRCTWSQEERKQIEIMIKGIEGERTLRKMIEEYGQDSWKIYTDISLQNKNYAQYDLLLYNGQAIYHLEVKNFEGEYTISPDGQWSVAGKVLNNDPIQQMKRAHRILENCLVNMNVNIEVKSLLLMINPNFTLSPGSRIPEGLLTYWHIPQTIRSWHTEYWIHDEDPIHYLVTHYSCKNPWKFVNVKNNIQWGIRCPFCGGTDYILRRKYFYCRCGKKATKNALVEKHIEDYSILYFKQHIKAGDIYRFMNKEVSLSTIYRLLENNYHKISSKYVNVYKNKYYFSE